MCGRLNELTGGESLRANLALVKNNARTGAQVARHLANLKSASTPVSQPSPSSSLSSNATTISSPSDSCLPPPVSAGGPVVVGGCNYDIVVRMGEDIRMDGSTHSGSLEFRPVIRLRTRHGYLCSTIAIVSELFFFDRAANTMQFDGYPDPEFFKDANSNPALFCKNIVVFIPTVPYCCRLSRRFCILSDFNNILVNI